MVCLCALTTLGVLLFLDSQREFPDIPQGLYAGAIHFTHKNAPEEHIPLYLHRTSTEEKVFVSLESQGFSAQIISLSARLGFGAKGFLPLTISTRERKFRLHEGDKKNQSETGFRGDVIDTNSNTEGTWELRKIFLDDAAPEEELHLWTRRYRAVLSALETTASNQNLAQEQSARLAQLQQASLSSEDLKKESDLRSEKKQLQLDETRKALEATRSELERLEAQLSRMRETTPYGKLVKLSRDSLDRDYEFIDKQLVGIKPELSPDFQNQIDRAQRVQSLQNEVQTEREHIERLRNDEEATTQQEPEE